MPENDIAYFRRRAEAELDHARRASRPEAERVHAELADAYLSRIAAAGPVVRMENG